MDFARLATQASAYDLLDHEVRRMRADASHANTPEWGPHLVVVSPRGWQALCEDAAAPGHFRLANQARLDPASRGGHLGAPFVLDSRTPELWLVLDAEDAHCYLREAWRRGVVRRELQSAITGRYGGRFRPRRRRAI